VSCSATLNTREPSPSFTNVYSHYQSTNSTTFNKQPPDFAASVWLRQAIRDVCSQQTPATTSKSRNNSMHELQTQQTQGTLLKTLYVGNSGFESNSALHWRSAMDRSHAVVLVPIRGTSVNTSWAKTNASKSAKILMIDRKLSHILMMRLCKQIFAPKSHRCVLEACHSA
jgi:hypothetical protein